MIELTRCGAPDNDRYLPAVMTQGDASTYQTMIDNSTMQTRSQQMVGRAFGSAAKEVAVKKPLLVQATLPRVVSTDEEIELPVTVFALEKGVGKTDVRVTVNEAFSVVGPQSRSVVLGDEGEQVVTFRLKAGRQTGIGKVRVTAASSGDNSASEIEIDVREPNPYVTTSEDPFSSRAKRSG